MEPKTTEAEMAPDRDAYSIEEAGRRLGGVSQDAIRNAIRGGQLRAVRLGRRVLIPRDEIRRFLADRMDRATAAAVA